MSRPIAEIEREVLVTYFEEHWTRTQLATFPGAPTIPDPGHGRDALSAVTFFGHPFNASKDDDLKALSDFAVQELRGQDQWSLLILDGVLVGQTLNLVSADGITFILQALGGDEEVVYHEDLEDGADVPFTGTVSGDFTATVTSVWIHGAGFVILNIEEIGPGGPGNRGYYETGRLAEREARVRLSVVIASPPQSSPRLAEQYAGAAAAILTGVDFIRDAAATPGTLEREMADAGMSSIRQRTMDPVMVVANHIGDEHGFRWYLFQIVFRRLFHLERAGQRPIIP